MTPKGHPGQEKVNPGWPGYCNLIRFLQVYRDPSTALRRPLALLLPFFLQISLLEPPPD
jgi:hypothetical protein